MKVEVKNASANNAKAPFLKGLRDELQKEDSPLRDQVNFVMECVATSTSNTSVPLVDNKGYYMYQFVVMESDDEGNMMIVQNIVQWLMDNRKYPVPYHVATPHETTPTTGPVMPSNCMTPRDVVTLITKIFGEPTTFGGHNLPANWANENPHDLATFVDLTNVNTELKDLLNIPESKAEHEPDTDESIDEPNNAGA